MFDRDKWTEIWNSLAKNKMRTTLTAFGVFWGIFMLMVMLGSGKGLENGVKDGMGDFATNSVFMWSRSTSVPYQGLPRGRRFDFRNDDVKALRENIEELDILSPRLQVYGRDGNNVVRGLKAGAFSVFGDYAQWNEIDPVDVVQGRFINQNDTDQRRKVAVIGQKVRDVLFEKEENPIGEYIRINGIYFQVVGVFKPLSTNMNFGGYEESIHLPFTTIQQASIMRPHLVCHDGPGRGMLLHSRVKVHDCLRTPQSSTLSDNRHWVLTRKRPQMQASFW